jgi:hypothetical protein
VISERARPNPLSGAYNDEEASMKDTSTTRASELCVALADNESAFDDIPHEDIETARQIRIAREAARPRATDGIRVEVLRMSQFGEEIKANLLAERNAEASRRGNKNKAKWHKATMVALDTLEISRKELCLIIAENYRVTPEAVNNHISKTLRKKP